MHCFSSILTENRQRTNLVFALLPQLGEHFLVHLATLSLPFLPLLGGLGPGHLAGPLRGQLAVGHSHVPGTDNNNNMS